jgi:hypothetical protein
MGAEEEKNPLLKNSTGKIEVPYALEDGSVDLEAWANRDPEGLYEERDPVAIQCDIRLLNWKLLAIYQYTKFG